MRRKIVDFFKLNMCCNMLSLVYMSFLAITIVFGYEKGSEKDQNFEYFFLEDKSWKYIYGEVKDFPRFFYCGFGSYIADSEV